MKRREFLRNVAATGGVAALSGLPKVQGEKEAPVSRDSNGKYIERFPESSRVRSGMALGGIGAGYFEVRKDGRFYDWNIFNNFPKETGSAFVLPPGEIEDRAAANLFFEVRFQVDGGPPRIKLLQLNNSLYEGAEMGIAYSFPWMQAVESIEYSARFPIASLLFTDGDMPFDIRLEAWSSFIPHDIRNSSLPLVFFDFTIRGKSSSKVDVTLLMTARNSTGYDTPGRFYTTQIDRRGGALTVNMGCGGMSEQASSWGQIAIASLSAQSSYYTGWGHRHPYYEQALRRASLPNIDDTNGQQSDPDLPPWMPRTGGRNRSDQATGQLRAHDPDVFSTVAYSSALDGVRSSVSHTFLYGWNFPNLYNEQTFRVQGTRIEGHYYSNFFASAQDVVNYGSKHRDDLKRRTNEFLTNFFLSDIETEVLEQVNSQLNTFFTSGRLVRNGDFGILEGLASTWSWGPIATIDVMFYGSAPIVALFPELQKATMRCHAAVQRPSGEINHGLLKDFRIGEDATAGVTHRIDLAGQFAIMVLRDFFWTNDVAYLRTMMPAVERAIDYILRDRSGRDGSMPVTDKIETSYDNFAMYGYASYLLSQWMCALASARDASSALGDPAAAQRYRRLYEKTARRMEETLWNGSYYRLFTDLDQPTAHGSDGEGCLTDQLSGQWAAYCSGLGELVPIERTRAALKSILARNYRQSFGLRNCSFRADGELSQVDRDVWNDQANTCWSGVELAFSAFLLYAGMYSEGVAVAKTVDARYRKNGLYWNHQEFGGHYFRPMSAWSIINAMLGFSIHCGRLSFDPKPPQKHLTLFFATPAGTGRYTRTDGNTTVTCLTGNIAFTDLCLRDPSLTVASIPSQSKSVPIVAREGWRWASFPSVQSLAPSEVLVCS